MKDDVEFNIRFISLVEEFGCIYEYTTSDYSTRQIQDKAWKHIANEVEESVRMCKERWKNLRACYTRHLKNSVRTYRSAAKFKRPYYLAKYLEFLRPFTRSCGSKNNEQSEGVFLFPELISEDNITKESEFDEANDSPEEPDTQQQSPPQSSNEDLDSDVPNSKKFKFSSKSISDVRESTLECIQSTQTALSNKVKHNLAQDPDLSFLISVLPDMKEMNREQKRRFKIAILNLSGQILLGS